MTETFLTLNESINDANGDGKITVLLIDDQEMVGASLKDMLKDEKHIDFNFCSNPKNAIDVANDISPHVILQDLVMPDIDGLTLVKYFRANEETQDVPLIVLSSKEDPETKYQAFSLGASDYMVKFPDKLEVLARINYHSNAYLNKLQKDKAFKALAISQKLLKSELEEAKNYAESLLPKPINDKKLKTDSVFISSTVLGGDSYGYYWLDENHFVMYLLDVCGHGVGAALLSVSVLNALRSQSLTDTNFKDPGSVLSSLNKTFDMEKQNGMYFTMWYAVYDAQNRVLTHASGGHPPAVLVKTNQETVLLKTPGMVVGGVPDMKYQAQSLDINSGDKLYMFSDGVYEVDYISKGRMMNFDDFKEKLAEPVHESISKVKSMVKFSQEAQNTDRFYDDFSLVEVTFK